MQTSTESVEPARARISSAVFDEWCALFMNLRLLA